MVPNYFTVQRILAPPTPPCSQPSTFDLVSAVIEDDLEDIIDGTIGVQRIGVAMVAHKAMSPTENQDRPIDQLENKFFILPCGQITGGQRVLGLT